MSDRSKLDSTAQVKKRLTTFLDCVARLIAKRALREQRSEEKRSMHGGKDRVADS